MSKRRKIRRRREPVVKDEAYYQRQAETRALVLKILKITFLGVIALCFTAFALRWGYRQLRRHESAKLVSIAESYIKQGKIKEAVMSLDTAMRVNPANTEALVIRARLSYSQNEGSDAIASFDKIFYAQKLTLSDLRPYARLAASHGRWDFAERLANAPDPKFDPAMTHIIHADLLALRGKYHEAEEELRKGVKVDTVDTGHIALIQFLASRDDSDKTHDEVFHLLKELSARKSLIGAEAMADALNNPGLIPAGEVNEWIKLLRNHPMATPQMLLVADAAAVRADPSSKSVVTESLIARLSHASLDQRMLGAKWLIAEGESEKVLALISREQAFTNLESFQLWIGACELSKRWDDILAALNSSANPMPPLAARLLKAEVLAKAGHSDESQAEFQKIWEDVGTKQPDCYEVIACLASLDKKGEGDLFKAAFWKLLSDPATAWHTLQEVVSIVRSQRDAVALKKIYALAADSPTLSKNPVVLNQLAYLDLVLGHPADSAAFAAMVARITTNPNELSFHATYALALLLSGQKGEALQQLEKLQAVDPARLMPDQLAIMAGILAQNGEQDLSRRIQVAIPKQALSEQEWTLLNHNMESLPQPVAPSPEASLPPTLKNTKPALTLPLGTNSPITNPTLPSAQ